MDIFANNIYKGRTTEFFPLCQQDLPYIKKGHQVCTQYLTILEMKLTQQQIDVGMGRYSVIRRDDSVRRDDGVRRDVDLKRGVSVRRDSGIRRDIGVRGENAFRQDIAVRKDLGVWRDVGVRENGVRRYLGVRIKLLSRKRSIVSALNLF